MFRCDEVTRLVASGELAEAGWWTRFSVRVHLLLCGHCRRYAAQMRRIGGWARQFATGEPEDPETLARVRDRILSGD